MVKKLKNCGLGEDSPGSSKGQWVSLPGLLLPQVQYNTCTLVVGSRSDL